MNRSIPSYFPIALAGFLAACGGSSSAGPVTVNAGSDRSASPCERIVIEGAVTGAPRSVHWEASGYPLVLLDELSTGRVAFRAPALVVPTTLTLELVAEASDGETVRDGIQITVAAAQESAAWGPGSVPACAPFSAGVASGDPDADSVQLWTRIDPDTAAADTAVRWQVARDPLFRDIARQGQELPQAAADYTMNISVDGLEPGTTYYYRFIAGDGTLSDLGRTRTAPVGDIDRVRFAVTSCSSIYSGYFNAYRRIAERSDLDLVIHLGDYIYDFVDNEERVRIPEPYPSAPQNLTEWRARHEYYLADPDLRLARAMHPWFLLWDNHDVERRARPDYNGSVQAFHEWNPIRRPDPDRPDRIYRSLHFGDLVDVLLLDVLLHREIDTVPGTEAPSILGDEQWDWLEPRLQQSGAAWRVIGSQKLFGQAKVDPNLVAAFAGERREIFDPETWDGFPEDRSRLLALLDRNDIVDNVFLSGDSHISIFMDVVDDYDAPTRGLGGEMLPTSISRGNFDEALGTLAQPSLLNFIVNDTLRRNPHGRYLELTRHGYGTIDITPERVAATIWYSDILSRVDHEEAGPTFLLHHDSGAWTPAPVDS